MKLGLLQLTCLAWIGHLSRADDKNKAIDVFTACSKKFQMKDAADLEPGLVEHYCTSVRYDIIPCINKKLGQKDDGSLAERSRSLLNALHKSQGHKSLLRAVKQFHVICVYNNWADFRTKECINETVEKCVTGRESCHYKNSCDLDVPNVVFRLSAAGHVKSLSISPKEAEKKKERKATRKSDSTKKGNSTTSVFVPLTSLLICLISSRAHLTS
ncbi:hypothetical protein WR25_20862 [Diploscapter pachys]|uniref:Chondroitin proteoglycan 4 domain-containing protein n=1 Tax=Diploscapter pachys TaxID=2018661 RepID=A0A2A2JPL9_9BILA|nr:hypothetical protein WR25_20862 [Diploscapter pachys]